MKTQLDKKVVEYTSKGYSVVYSTEDQVVLSKKKSISHCTHAFFSIVTGGLWLIAWLIFLLQRKEERLILTIDGDKITTKKG